MKAAALLVALAVALPAFAEDPRPISPADEKVLADFSRFAEAEVPKQKAQFADYVDKFVEEPLGMRIAGKKHLFTGYKVEAVPDTHFFDVKKTDSIVSPYRAVIEFPVVFVKAQIWVRGWKEDCNRQTLKHCLEHEGEPFETDLLYRNSAVRFPRRVEREYLYQDGQWVPKVDLRVVLTTIIADLAIEKPMPPNAAPSIFDLPTETPSEH